jgi:hypothetical protein
VVDAAAQVQERLRAERLWLALRPGVLMTVVRKLLAAVAGVAVALVFAQGVA